MPATCRKRRSGAHADAAAGCVCPSGARRRTRRRTPQMRSSRAVRAQLAAAHAPNRRSSPAGRTPYSRAARRQRAEQFRPGLQRAPPDSPPVCIPPLCSPHIRSGPAGSSRRAIRNSVYATWPKRSHILDPRACWARSGSCRRVVVCFHSDRATRRPGAQTRGLANEHCTPRHRGEGGALCGGA